MTARRALAARLKESPGKAALALLAALLLIRAAVLSWIFFGVQRGFYFFSGDYPSRVVIAYDWMRHPSFLLGGMWLPVNFYVTGIVLRLWPNPTLAPNVFHILLSSATVALVYASTRRLFPDRRWAAPLATLPVLLETLLIRLSISGGASEVDAQFFLAAGALFWIRFQERESRRDLFLMAAFLAAAGGTRHEAWCFLVLPAADLLRRAWRGRRAENLAALLLMWAPAAAWIASRAADGYILLLPFGDIAKNLTSGVPLSASGIQPWTELFWVYPRLLWQYDPLPLGLSLAGAALALRREPRSRRYALWIATALFGYCLTPVLSIAFASAPERVSIVFLFFLAPFTGYLLDDVAGRFKGYRRAAVALLVIAALAADARQVLWLRRWLLRSGPAAEDTLAAGVRLAGLRSAIGPLSRVLLEVPVHSSGEDSNRIWDYNVFLYAVAPHGVLDRDTPPLRGDGHGTFDLDTQAAPTVFGLDDAAFAKFCADQHLSFALVHTPEAVRKLRGIMTPTARIGMYTLLSRADPSGIDWVRIPGGSFLMGSKSGNETPIHRVTLKPFDMARTLVTNKQYKACMDAGVCTAPADRGARFDGGDQPVVGVDWGQAKAFSAWAGGSLPSESQYEYAARSGGKDKKMPWGGDLADCTRAVFSGCSSATMPVCSKPKGNTEQGLCDMAGNAEEWTEDYYHDSYAGAPSDGSAWEKPGFFRVVRGGSWNYDPSYAGVTQRRLNDPLYHFYYFGFRPVRAVKSE